MDSASPPRWLIDVACVLVVAATIAMYFVDQSLASDPTSARTILGLAIGKSVLVGALFMGLLWKARPLFVALTCSFLGLYLVLIAVLT